MGGDCLFTLCQNDPELSAQSSAHTGVFFHGLQTVQAERPVKSTPHVEHTAAACASLSPEKIARVEHLTTAYSGYMVPHEETDLVRFEF